MTPHDATSRKPFVAAVVIGGSIAGLAAARVLSEVFERVVVLDRDDIDAGGERKGIPQATHSHIVSCRADRELGSLFPGLGDELVRLGGQRLELGQDIRFVLGHPFARYQSGLMSPAQSRGLLEDTVRKRVRDLPGVTLYGSRRVVGLTASAGAVTGVRAVADGVESHVPAQLVVDASGRSSEAALWLTSAGLTAPEQSSVEVDIGYTTREYRRTGPLRDGFGAVLAARGAPDRRMGAVLPIEGERWLVTMGGWLGEHAPHDDAGFRQFSEGLPVRDFHDLVTTAEPLGPARVCKFPASLWRHYERGSPGAFVAVGDAYGAFNPIYGQGLAAATRVCGELGRALGIAAATGTLDGLESRYFRRAGPIVGWYFGRAVGEDLRFPEVAGVRSRGLTLRHSFTRRLMELASRHPYVADRFYRVNNGFSSELTFLHPRVLLALASEPRLAPALGWQ